MCPACVAVAGPAQRRPIAECLHVARTLLSRAAADWWQEAEWRYRRSQVPEAGSVLVFRRTSRLPSGHISVVSRVLSERQILVTHANWLRDHVSEDAPVVDVSPDNDWTLVRVWWPPTNR